MKRRFSLGFILACAAASSCGSDDGAATNGGNGSGNGGGGGGGGGTQSATDLAGSLREKKNFLIGIGNSGDDAYSLGVPFDIHYEYLVGTTEDDGWPSWNTDDHGKGAYLSMVADSSAAHGMTPMFTMYGMAGRGDGDLSVLTDASFMRKYFEAAKLVMTRLALFGKPALVQLEPDFWGYAVAQSPDAKGAVKVSGSTPECVSLGNDIAGFFGCWKKLRDQYAPKVSLGVHVSDFGTDLPTTLAFFKAVGAPQADFLTTDMLDRDAGCFEAKIDPNCQRDEGGWYWDETNQTSPNFHQHLDWVKQISTGLGRPMVWWQVPFGVPSATPGGKPGHYRDNRVKYIFEHIGEFIAAGGIGAVFGTGAENQTDYKTDGGQFKNAATKYFANPTPR